jgi:acetyl esterase/lipase
MAKMVMNILRFIKIYFQPSLDAIFGRNIPFSHRWRMLLFLQPAALITTSISALPWLFKRRFSVHYLPIAPGRAVRVCVFKAASKSTSPDEDDQKLRPLHIDIHGGAFMGGIPEADAAWCTLFAESTGAVVVSTTYRFAPRYPFPAAIDDIDAVVRYLQKHAQEQFGANPELMTIGGSSAGANLGLAASQQPEAMGTARLGLKGAITFAGAVSHLFWVSFLRMCD